MKINDNQWVDEKIELDDIKKSRGLDEISSETRDSTLFKSNQTLDRNPLESIALKDEENLYKISSEKPNSYMNIQDNYSLESKALNYDYEVYKPLTPKVSQSKPPECERYRTFQIESSHDELAMVKAKLETKKLRLREMKNQFENVCEENASLKFRLAELEKKRPSAEKEKDLANIIEHLEEEKIRLEERLSKLQALDNVKNKEIELMNQKIRDFEIILDENQNEHVENIKSMKIELESLKYQQNEYEKCLDILNYFFKKIYSYFPKNKNANNNHNDELLLNKVNLKQLQNKLIDIENFIVKILNEKTALNNKYSKVLDIQTKLTHSEGLDTSQMHIENVKKLNEKIYDLTEENNFLKHQLEKLDNRIESISNSNESEHLKKTDKENVFRNNFTKEQKNHQGQNEESLLNIADKSLITNNAGDSRLSLNDNLRTLEQRVIELEKEFKKNKKPEETKEIKQRSNASSGGGINSQNTNKEKARSKSAIKKTANSGYSNIISNTAITQNKVKKKKQKSSEEISQSNHSQKAKKNVSNISSHSNIHNKRK